MYELLIGVLSTIVAAPAMFALALGAKKVKELAAPLRGSAMPIVTLSNGLRVGNFSSPHSFKFTDGTELPACVAERSAMSALEATENVCSGAKAKWTDISIEFKLSEQCRIALHEAAKMPVDIIIVPRVVKDALAAEGRCIAKSKFRTGRLADRVLKLHFTDKFCI